MRIFSKLFWVYGTIGNITARKHRITGRVEFLLWPAGEQGHKRDYWYPPHEDHWDKFEQTK